MCVTGPAAAVLSGWSGRSTEHVPAFAKATINGGRLLYLDKPQIKALGMDDIDCEIVLARLQLLHRQDRFPRATPAPSQAR